MRNSDSADVRRARTHSNSPLDGLPSFSQAAIALLCLCAGPALGVGIGRFAYALVLPDMRSTLQWSYTQAGFMNTANGIGYLAGALTAPIAIRGIGASRLVVVAATLTTLSLFCTSLTGTFELLAFTRLLTGLGGGMIFVAGGALAAVISQPYGKRAGFLLSLFYVGPGIGILLSGVSIPYIISGFGAGSWWIAWCVLGVVSVLLASLLPFALRAGHIPPHHSSATIRLNEIAPLLVSYFAFGAGYIVYMTFILALINNTGSTPGLQSAFWCALGVGGISAPWVWSRLLAKMSGGYPVAVMSAITLVGAISPLISQSLVSVLGSALIFGSAFFAVVSSTTAFVRKNFPQSAWPAGIAAMTVSFGIGQAVGPVMTGMVIDHFNNVATGLWISNAIMLIATVLAAQQNDLRAQTRSS